MLTLLMLMVEVIPVFIAWHFPSLDNIDYYYDIDYDDNYNTGIEDLDTFPQCEYKGHGILGREHSYNINDNPFLWYEITEFARYEGGLTNLPLRCNYIHQIKLQTGDWYCIIFTNHDKTMVFEVYVFAKPRGTRPWWRYLKGVWNHDRTEPKYYNTNTSDPLHLYPNYEFMWWDGHYFRNSYERRRY